MTNDSSNFLNLLSEIVECLQQGPVLERLLVLVGHFGPCGRAFAAHDITIPAILQIGPQLALLGRHGKAFAGLDAPFIDFLAVRKTMNVLAARPPVTSRRQLEGT